MLSSLAGVPPFVAYFLAAIALCVVYMVVYDRITPHPELELMTKGNAAAAVAQGIGLVGFAIPLASAIYNTHSILESMLWGFIALVTQVAAFFLAGLAQRNLSDRIAAGEMAAAVWLGFVSLAAGILSAACMSY